MGELVPKLTIQPSRYPSTGWRRHSTGAGGAITRISRKLLSRLKCVPETRYCTQDLVACVLYRAQVPRATSRAGPGRGPVGEVAGARSRGRTAERQVATRHSPRASRRVHGSCARKIIMNI